MYVYLFQLLFHRVTAIYTVGHKKRATFILLITLVNIDGFS